jgi:F-type H+-transporting ATPase subunit gamma
VASLKELKGRINSVKSTQKITKAKQMVAAAKLRKAQAAAEAARPYAARLAEVMASLASKVVVSENSPKLLAGTGKDQVHLLVVANSDKGLAGAFNSNIVKAALIKARELEASGKTVLFFLVGKKGRPVIRRNYPQAIVQMFDTTDVREPGFNEAGRIADELVALYEAGKFDVAHLFFSKFRNALIQEPTEQQIIPVPAPKVAVASTGAVVEYEQGASMTAMDNATRNAGDLINALTIQYNRSRQAAITTELIEIIAGAEAL